MRRKFFWIFLLFHSFLISGEWKAQAQSNSVEKIKQSIEEKNYSHARIQLAVLVAEESPLLLQLSEQAEFLAFFSEDSTHLDPREGSLDTLKQIYEICINIDREKKFDWLMRKAMLFMNFPEYFPGEKEPALKACLTLEPFLCPVLIAEALAKTEIERFEKHEIPLEELAFTWAETDRYFSSRNISAGKSKAEIQATQKRMHELFAAVFPDCAGIQDRYLGNALSGDVTPEKARAVLCLIFFRGCENFPLTTSLFSIIENTETHAWWFRKMAVLANHPDEKEKAIEKSISLETWPELKALDLISLSEIYVSRQDFPGAIKKLESAVQFAPNWGEPQMAMAGVFITGASTCGFDPFTRKAVYWVAIDFCREALDRDPGTAKVANERIFEYRKLAPTQAEAGVRNLGMGDTWPLGCWMKRVAVVRF